MDSKTAVAMVFAALAAFSLPAYAFSSTAAFEWLDSHDANGSYGFAGANALALAALGEWGENAQLQSQLADTVRADLNDNASWNWAEADLPSIQFWALHETGFASAGIDSATLSQKILAFKGQHGGFTGLQECVANCTDPNWQNQVWQPVETTTDTALVLLALESAGTLDSQTKNEAIAFLHSLQNEDGSFKQSLSTSETQLYALGPDFVSTTSLALEAMQQTGFGATPEVAKAIAFLKQKARSCFGNSGSAYGPSRAAVAFAKSGEGAFASSAAAYAALSQKQDGGFADPLRSQSDSNAMDTAMALLAAKNIAENSVPCAPLSATLAYNTPIFPGNSQPMRITAEGAVENVSFTVTKPSGGFVELQAQQTQQGVFETVFSVTAEEGNYSILATINAMQGGRLVKSGVFEVKSASSSPTPAPTPTPTPSPSNQEIKVVFVTPYPSPTPAATPSITPTLAPTPQRETAKESVSTKQNEEATTPSGLTALAAAKPNAWFSFSVDEKNMALSLNPIVFISLLALGIIFSLYKHYSKSNTRGLK